MKEEKVLIIVILSLIITIMFNGGGDNGRRISSVITEEEYKYDSFIDSIMSTEKLREKLTETVTVTRYNPVIEQCDDDPLITADNSKIDLKKLNIGKLRWIAVSRDLREKFPYGSKVRLIVGDKEIDGIYYVHDTMNPRFKSRIDILSPVNEKTGMWKNAEIIRED